MSKQIKEYTLDELFNKIKALEMERDKIENTLKRYKKEAESRKQEVPLGVPMEIKKPTKVIIVDAGGEDRFLIADPKDKFGKPLCDMFNTFHSRESAIKHSEMLRDWRKDGLIANAKGEQISIQVLLPLLKKGKVLFSPYDKKWKWVDNKTIICPENYGWFLQGGKVVTIEGFNIKPADDWENSVMECGL